MARLWVRAIERFHEGLIAHGDGSPDALPTTGELHETVVHINDEVYARYAALATKHWGELTERRIFLLRMGCLQGPYGLVRPFCGVDVPVELDDVVEASARAVLALG